MLQSATSGFVCSANAASDDQILGLPHANEPESETTVQANNNLGLILRFLDELRKNNNKIWFEQHRPDYAAARGAFEQLIDELIDEFRVPDHLQGLTAKDCIARIYREIRFTRDKSPYKTNLAALIAPGGWRSTYLGYYLSIAPHGQSMVAGGLYLPTPEQLNRFRQVIADNADTFKKIIGAEDFLQAFGFLEGERLKTAPKGYDRTHPEIALLQLKQITVVHHFSDQEVVAHDFSAQVAKICQAMKPFLAYLSSITQ